MLDRVTITGADDSVRPSDLIELSTRYPFVEWGILASQSREWTPRYPSTNWISILQDMAIAMPTPPKLCLHLCGRYVRNLLVGEISFPRVLLDGFDRVQLNFHAEKVEMDRVKCVEALRSIGGRQFLFQIDGADGNAHFQRILAERGNLVDVAPLFDVSGGAGVLPEQWPQACYVNDRGLVYHGYAGGLGPDNLVEQIPKIAVAAGCRHWIDMETRVRSDDDVVFDLSKVEMALRIAQGFMTKPDVYSRRA